MAARFKAARARPSSWTRSCSRIKWSSSEMGESLRLMAFCVAESSSLAAWSRPSVRSTSWRDRVVTASAVARIGGGGFGGVGGFGGLEEGIVRLQGVRLDDDFVGHGVAGEDGLRWLAEAAGEAALVNQGSDIPSAKGACSESPLHAFGEVGRAVELQQSTELLDLAFEIDAASSDLLQVHSALGRESGEAIAATRSSTGRAPLEEGVDMRAVFDGLPAPPAAGVLGDGDAVGQDADAGVIGAQQDVVADEAAVHRVGVGVEVDAGFLGHDHRQDEIGVEGVLGQGTKPGTLDEEAFRGALARSAVNAGIGGFRGPGEGLLAQVVEGGECPAVEERMTDEFDGGFDAALELWIAYG